MIAEQPGAQRTVQGFETTLKGDVQSFVDLRAKAAAGDAVAQVDFALLECELGRITFDVLKTRIEGKSLSDAQQDGLKGAEATSVLAEALRAINEARGDREAFRAAGKRLADARAGGLVPKRVERRQEFYGILLNYAFLEEDPDLADTALAGLRAALKQMLGDDPRIEKSLKTAEDKIAEMRAKQQEGCGSDEGMETGGEKAPEGAK